MPDIILDTNVLGEFFEQYFNSAKANRGQGNFMPGQFLSDLAVHEINRIVRSYRRHGDIKGGIIVISSFAFVELFRKWDQITNGQVDLYKLRGTLLQPPDWLNIVSLDETLLPYFLDVPTNVYVNDGFKSVDWTDSIHIATALARGDGHFIATTDNVMRNLNLLSRVKCV